MAHVIDAVLQLKDQFSAQLKNVSQNLTEFQKHSKYVASNLKKTGRFTEQLGSSLTKNVTLPLAAIGTLALKTSNDFQEGMAKVSTIADTTKTSIKTLSNGLINLSKETGLSLKDLTEAEYQALSAGVDTGKVTEFLGVATKAAKGGFTDTTTAVDGLTNVLNAYGLTADKANQIANQMLITQNLGKTTFGDLASAIGKVSATAHAAQISTKELFSSLVVTTAQGLSTSESVTGLKAAISNIIKPSKEAADAADALGIKFDVGQIKTKGWMGFLQDLKQKLNNVSPAISDMSKQYAHNFNEMQRLERQGKKNTSVYKGLKKVNKSLIKKMDLLAKSGDSTVSQLSTMFGSVEGLNAVLMLTSDEGLNKYNEAIKQMGSNTDVLQKAYNKMETPLEKFKKQINKLKISLLGVGGKLQPMMAELGNAIGTIADKISKLTPHQQEMIVKWGLIAAGVGPVLVSIGKTTFTIGKTITSINKLNKEIKTAGGVLKYLKTPGSKAVIIMTALALVAILIITNWSKITACFNKVANAISKATGISSKSVKKFLGVVLASLPVALAIGKIFGSGFGTVFRILGRVTGSTTRFMISILGKFFAFMLANPLVAVITGIIAACVLIYEAWKHNWGGIRDKTHKVIEFCNKKIESIKEVFAKVQEKCEEFGEKIKGVWKGLKEFFAHPIQGTISLVKNGDLSGIKGHNALGTAYWGGGLSIVGEYGPEVVEMPQGSKVYDNKESRKMFNNHSNINITFGDVHVRKESDIDAIADAITRKLKTQSLNMS